MSCDYLLSNSIKLIFDYLFFLYFVEYQRFNVVQVVRAIVSLVIILSDDF